MKLFIDTSDREKIVIGLDAKRYETNSKDGASQKLLFFIDHVLSSVGRSVSDITEISVNTGPGSFTGVRVGVAIANTLSWVLKVPVNGKNEPETKLIYK